MASSNGAPPPSTEWRERVAPDEEQRYAVYAEKFREVQARKSRRYGNGRTLHRRQLAAAQGTLEVLDGIPNWCKHGLFAEARDYEVWVRLSNGGVDHAPDHVPDIRGFALRVFGVRGASALGGPASSQDFTLINHEAFAFSTSEEFIDFVVAASHGNGALFKHVLQRYGVLGVPRQLGRMVRIMGKPFSGFATEALFSTLPMANGPFAVRVRLVPSESNGRPAPGAKRDWAGDFALRLREHPLHWDMQLQYFANEELTPIENAAVVWPTPYTTVARLMLPLQDLQSPAALEHAQTVEGSVIDPWQALAEHRPLGEVQRARKVVYFASQQGRGAA